MDEVWSAVFAFTYVVCVMGLLYLLDRSWSWWKSRRR